MKIHHLNCGILHVPPNPTAACHCLLLEHQGQLALIDTGIGLQDVARPLERIGQPAILAAGFQFHEHLTAARQVEMLGFSAVDVTDIVLNLKQEIEECFVYYLLSSSFFSECSTFIVPLDVALQL